MKFNTEQTEHEGTPQTHRQKSISNENKTENRNKDFISIPTDSLLWLIDKICLGVPPCNFTSVHSSASSRPKKHILATETSIWHNYNKILMLSQISANSIFIAKRSYLDY